jgi:hypothetical protein
MLPPFYALERLKRLIEPFLKKKALGGANMTEIGKKIVEGLTSDNDEKKVADIKAVGNFLKIEGVPMTTPDGQPNITYMRGVYMVKAIQREYFNQLFNQDNQPKEDE